MAYKILQIATPETKQTQTSAPVRSKPGAVLHQEPQVMPGMNQLHHFGRISVSGNGATLSAATRNTMENIFQTDIYR